MTGEDCKFAISVGIELSDLRQYIDKRFGASDRRFKDLTRFIDARFDAQDEKLYRVEQVLDAA